MVTKMAKDFRPFQFVFILNYAPVWFSFWVASGRQKLKLEPDDKILAQLLREALG
jgi:hypothetical protein